MKKLLTLAALASLLFFGCNQEAELTSPIVDSSDQTFNWITLPTPSDMSVNSPTFTKVKNIGGGEGGQIRLDKEYNGGPFGTVKIHSNLTIRKASFQGRRDISMTCFAEDGLVEFGPSMVFNKNLEYTLTYRGVDLTGVNPESVKFCYIAADGSIVEAENSGIYIDFSIGRIRVEGALIPHFSRYGFTR